MSNSYEIIKTFIKFANMHNNSFFSFKFFWQIAKTSINFLMYMTNNKETQLHFFKQLLGYQL